jgi:3',5'-nucleoside bisphosphate phosphatase
MSRKNLILIFALIVFANSVMSAQHTNYVKIPGIAVENARKMIHIPDIPGYKTLKCDFHMHTIFSDGDVWPTVRVDEAWKHGLDAISITDHIENNPSKQFVNGDDNSSYEIAKPYADKKGMLLIKGSEITRSMPPGHFNALFITNSNQLDKPDYMDVFEEAKKQGAFIIWNHPGWKPQQPDTCKWWDVHTELLNKGMLHAIEVFNEQEYYPAAFDWCNEKGLAYTAASDAHEPIGDFYNLSDYHRPMTIVFAKERTEEALREAMFAGRTVAWFANFLAGKEEFLHEIFKRSLEVKLISENDARRTYSVVNNSDVPFTIKLANRSEVVIFARRETVIYIPVTQGKTIEVSNLIIRRDKRLKVDFPF